MSHPEQKQPRRGIRRRLMLIGVGQLFVFFLIVFLYLPFLNNEMNRNLKNQREVANTVKRKEVETVAKLLAFEMGRLQYMNEMKAYCFSQGKTLGIDTQDFDPEPPINPMRSFLWEKMAFIEDIVYIDLLAFFHGQVLNIMPFGFAPPDYTATRINPVILEENGKDFFGDLNQADYEKVEKLTPLPPPFSTSKNEGDPFSPAKYLQRYLMPLYAEGTRWGTVRLVISTHDLRPVDISLKENERFKMRSLIAFAVTLFLGFAVSMAVLGYSARQVAAPIGALRGEIQNFSATQDFNQLLSRIDAMKFDAEDDFGLLAHAFRNMALQLRDTLQELQQSVTIKERALTELRESQKMLQESTKLATLGELGASFAHEINNKIQPAKIALLGLMEDAPEFPVKRSDMEMILACINDVAEFVERFRTFARPQHAFAPDVNLNSVIRDTLLLLEKTFQKARIVVRTELAPDLPRIYADENEIGQVLVNLLMNAKDAIEPTLGPHKDEGHIVIRTRAAEGAAQVEISDDGIGMTPEVLEKIFTPFFTTKGRARGTGLGLSIVKRILDGHKATITCQTQPGKGTTFTLTFPAQNGSSP